MNYPGLATLNTPRRIAVGITAIVALLLLLWLRLAHIRLSFQNPWADRPIAEVVIDRDIFFEIISDQPSTADSDPTAALNESTETNQSNPAPESGPDLSNSGATPEPPAPVTSNQPAPVKTQATQPAPAAPTREEIEAEEARRKANETVNAAFARTPGNENTAANGNAAGNTGSPDGTGSYHGVGTGSVGGGWFMPDYAKVPSTITGSIRVMVKIDSQGNVTSLSFLGGDPPAATDKALRAAVEAEIRSRRFIRGSSEAPDLSSAYITYRFR